MSDRLDEIRKTLDAITPGDWYVQREDREDGTILREIYTNRCHNFVAEIDERRREDTESAQILGGGETSVQTAHADAHFITEAPGIVRYLLIRAQDLAYRLGEALTDLNRYAGRGWHYCPEWDGLLVGPLTPEWGDDPDKCRCGTTPTGGSE